MENQGSFIIKNSKDGLFFFNLLAENGQVLATSETYSSKQAAQRGIQSVKDLVNGKALIIEDLT